MRPLYYTVFKNTTGALKTSMIGAITNVILNLIFIKFCGMNAAAWTTLISYIIVLAVRWNDTKENVSLRIPKFDTIVYLFALLISLLLYYVDNTWSYIVRVIVFVILVYKSKDVIAGL